MLHYSFILSEQNKWASWPKLGQHIPLSLWMSSEDGVHEEMKNVHFSIYFISWNTDFDIIVPNICRVCRMTQILYMQHLAWYTTNYIYIGWAAS